MLTGSTNRERPNFGGAKKKKNAESVMIDQLARTDKTVIGHSKLPAIPGSGLLGGVKLRGSASTWAWTKKKKKTEQSRASSPEAQGSTVTAVTEKSSAHVKRHICNMSTVVLKKGFVLSRCGCLKMLSQESILNSALVVRQGTKAFVSTVLHQNKSCMREPDVWRLNPSDRWVLVFNVLCGDRWNWSLR